MAARTLYTAGITGVGMSYPEKRLTNADLEKMVETNYALGKKFYSYEVLHKKLMGLML